MNCDLCGKSERATENFDFEGFRMRCKDRKQCEIRQKDLFPEKDLKELLRLEKEFKDLQSRIKEITEPVVNAALESKDLDRITGVLQQLRATPKINGFQGFRLQYAIFDPAS